MAEKQKGRKLTNISIDVAENGFEIRACYEPKKTLSQKAGWIPCSYEEPKKHVATSEAELYAQLKKIIGKTIE